MVDDSTCDDIVSWTENGTQFTIHQTNEFASELLLKYFKHRNFSSFVATQLLRRCTRDFTREPRVPNGPGDAPTRFS